MDKKKTILFHSNFSKKYTGFARNAKALLKYLYSTGKYNIVEYCSGMKVGDPSLKNMPWTTEGTLPDSDAELKAMSGGDPQKIRQINYGIGRINQVIQKYKPDVYIGVEDIWAFDKYWELPWWNKINCVIHTTLDSLPLLPLSLEAAPHIKNYYVWAKFAEDEMHRQGFNHVKTLHGTFGCENFYPLSDLEKKELRKQNKIPEDAFIIGFVFRNQLRKSVPNLLDGFKKFTTENPKVNAYLLLHTFWGEGWDINRLVAEKWGSPRKENESSKEYHDRLTQELKPILSKILATYHCTKCGKFEVRPFCGLETNCSCGGEKTLKNVNVDNGVSEEQLNKIYNLIDCYNQSMTSGGMEIPVFEAKLAGLITCVTNYSCGYEGCCPESYGLPLDWSEYREPGTQFIKASTNPSSICKQIKKVYEMSPQKRKECGKNAREYVLKNYSTSVVGKQWEEIIDNLPEINYDFNFDFKEKNINYQFKGQDIVENDLFIFDLYKNILLTEVDNKNEGFLHWINVLENNKNNQIQTRKAVYDFFIKTAREENAKNKKTSLEDLLDKNDLGKRICIAIPGNTEDVYMMTSLLSNIKKAYPEYNIYFATDPSNFELLDGNPYIHKLIPYTNGMDNIFVMEGQGSYNGYFDICFIPDTTTKKFISYTHNGKDNLSFDINDF